MLVIITIHWACCKQCHIYFHTHKKWNYFLWWCNQIITPTDIWFTFLFFVIIDSLAFGLDAGTLGANAASALDLASLLGSSIMDSGAGGLGAGAGAGHSAGGIDPFSGGGAVGGAAGGSVGLGIDAGLAIGGGPSGGGHGVGFGAGDALGVAGSGGIFIFILLWILWIFREIMIYNPS